MRHATRSIPVALATLALAATAAPATAATARNCGHWGYLDYAGEMAWTSDIEDISGVGIFNVKATKTLCSDARRVARNAGPWNRYRGWRCVTTKRAAEYQRIRCKHGRKIVRWETGA